MSETLYGGFNRMGKYQVSGKYQVKVQVPQAAVLRSPKRPSTRKGPTGSSGVAPATHKNLEEAFHIWWIWKKSWTVDINKAVYYFGILQTQSHADIVAHLSLTEYWAVVSFLSFPLTVGCWGPQAAAGSQSNSVSRQPISVVQRPSRVPQPAPDGPRHGGPPSVATATVVATLLGLSRGALLSVLTCC